MYKTILLTLIISTLFFGVFAQNNEEEEELEPIAQDLLMRIEAVSDSLLTLREQEVREQYGFSDKDKLEEVAELLEIENVDRWKSYLKLEAANKALDKISLRDLGITPYQTLLAKQYSIHRFTELSTMAEVAALYSIPIKSMRSLLGFDPLDEGKDNFSLQALEISTTDVVAMTTQFEAKTIPYGWSVTGAGMLIVFSALLIVSLIISQLKRVNIKPKKEEVHMVLNQKGKLVTRHNIDPNAVAAVIAVLHLYQTGIREHRKQLLTIKRTPTNQWRASQVMNMPNREHLRSRR
ncbi:MAG: OadG family protein [Candidatus Cloacimonetes bacterium]|nr:OadG family protein [Candidatus Cloacimonadota bacterium]NLO11726.1 OadG family protein [Candidatus Cloacimonadota bacterium]